MWWRGDGAEGRSLGDPASLLLAGEIPPVNGGLGAWLEEVCDEP